MTTAARSQGLEGPGSTVRGPLRRLVVPLGLGAAALGGALLLHTVFDPFRQDVPLCAVYHLTGLYCPGCGATRCVHALLDGDVLLALRNNAPLVIAAPFVVLAWARWVLRSARGLSAPALPEGRTVLALVGILAAFTVLRNLPLGAALAPTSLVGA